MADEGWLSDSEGRIENIALAPNAKNALFPLFEAIMNSIQAIEERFGRDDLVSGQIEITVHKDEHGEPTGFSVADNGIGFTTENLVSLRKFDSRKKAKIGGKGVGRLLWLKVVEKAAIQSQFFEDGAWKSISFDFTVTNPVSSLDERLPVGDRYLTEVTINPFRSEFATRIRESSRRLPTESLPTSSAILRTSRTLR